MLNIGVQMGFCLQRLLQTEEKCALLFFSCIHVRVLKIVLSAKYYVVLWKLYLMQLNTNKHELISTKNKIVIKTSSHQCTANKYGPSIAPWGSRIVIYRHRHRHTFIDTTTTTQTTLKTYYKQIIIKYTTTN